MINIGLFSSFNLYRVIDMKFSAYDSWGLPSTLISSINLIEISIQDLRLSSLELKLLSIYSELP